ncbi:TspO/MBR family protein [Candidatus Nitrosocosmicus franklandus]|uniref:Tryptophan-rich protein TspO n=1 Tax=Candidatus Nitrosocosmicus franklandianus TaxID=1798806 RepID=A0A484IFS8_9ARCH|nr:TspO/MBR family protein [Candidatus Nitrosocosmicus franklandus]VFJ14492.1 Tryptophan-rich protein TspO [Candidatus Nitrosocosmicus franklandus]
MISYVQKVLKFIISIIICQSAGIFGSLFTFDSISDWYVTLEKPAFAPPNWIFGPVWITLYFLMGLSLYIVWKDELKSKTRNAFFVVFGIQLILNALWSFLFFGLRSPFLGLLDIILLDIMVIVTIIYANSISKLAMILLIPYLIWIVFASFLNYVIFLVN